jgi:hypothetical protein
MKSANNTAPDICQLIEAYTGISTADQFQLCFDSAYIWLEKVLEPDRHGMEMLPLQPSFWTWWMKHWEIIDMGFMDSVSLEKNGQILVRLPAQDGWTVARSERHLACVWQEYHNPCYVRGNQQVLRQSFHQYIKSVVSNKK